MKNPFKTVLLYLIFVFLFSSCAWFSKSEQPDEGNKALIAEEYVTQGVNHFKAGEDSLAIKSWNKALEIIPDDAEIYNWTGIAYNKLNDLPQAAAAFKKAFDLDSSYYEAANYYGYILFLQKNYPEAREYFEKSVAINASYSPAIKNLELINKITTGSLNIEAFNSAEEAASKEDYSEQIPVYKKALTLDPDYAKAHNNLAVAFFYEGEYDSAYTHLEKAVTFNKEYPEAINNLGYLNKVNANYDVAIKLFLKALTIKPRYISALTNLGETYWESDDKINAKRVFSALLELDPNNQVAKRYMEEANETKGE